MTLVDILDGMKRMESQSVSIPKYGYSIAEAEVASGLSRASLYRLIAAGKLKTVTIGRRRLVPSDSLSELVESQGSQA